MLNTYEQANWASIPNTGVNMAKRARKTKNSFVLNLSKAQLFYLPFNIFRNQNDIEVGMRVFHSSFPTFSLTAGSGSSHFSPILVQFNARRTPHLSPLRHTMCKNCVSWFLGFAYRRFYCKHQTLKLPNSKRKCFGLDSFKILYT